MPSNRHLTWAEISDFAPGLWTAGDWLIPPTAAQTMTDCCPSVGGGLRAFFKPSDHSVSGLPTTTERITGIGLHDGIPHRTLATEAADLYVVTQHKTTQVPRLWRKDETAENPVGSGSWSAIQTWTAGTATPHETQFVPYVLADLSRHMVLSLFGGSGQDGLWSVAYTAGGVTSRTGGHPGVLAQHQARLVSSGISTSGFTIFFTDPGSFTFPAANVLSIEPSRQNSLNVMIMPFAPADLFVGKAGAGMHMIQGDLTDPIVRSMSNAQFQGIRQTPAYTPAGLVFLEPDTGVFATESGASYTRLDTQLGASGGPADYPADYSANPIGQCAFMHHWLFTPRGHVYDFRTKAWFKSSPISSPTPSFHYAVDTLSNRLLAPTYSPAGAFAIKDYRLHDGGTGTRFNTYTWKSAPLRDPSGRQLEIREVQAYVKAYDSSAQVAVTVNGTTRTVSGLAAGTHQLTFLFSERAEVLDVQVVPSAGSSSNEAPSIEVIRIGSKPSHLLR